MKKAGKFLFKVGKCTLIVFLCLIILWVVLYKIGYPGKKTKFDSVEAFVEYGGIILVDIPEGAENIKYYCNVNFGDLQSAYSFVINDEEIYNAFMEANEFEIHNNRTVEIYMTDPPMHGGEFPILNWYKYVVEEDISDYIFLEYDSFDGSFSTILVDKESRKFVVISHNVL